MNKNDNALTGQKIIGSKNYDGLDFFRIIAAFLIVAIHTSPLMTFNPTADFIVTRIIARIAVPFFFMVTGFFLLSGFMKKGDMAPIKKFLIKTANLYGIAILIYLPINLYAGYFNQKGVATVIKDLLVNGTFYHLWYLPAVILGVIVTVTLTKYFKEQTVIILSIVLYILGLLGDSYYGLTAEVPWLKTIYDTLFKLFDYTRNGIFYAPVFLIMGAFLGSKRQELTLTQSIKGLLFFSILLLAEGLTLHHYGYQRHDSMYIFLIPCMYYLFQSLLSFRGSRYQYLRTLSMVVYIIHPLAIIIVRGAAKVFGIESFFIYNSLLHYLAVCILSLLFGLSYVFVIRYFKKMRLGIKETPDTKGRAWIEINLENLRGNTEALQAVLPKDCTLMAVVKANAYGHGDIHIAKELNRIGIHSFAVATLTEGVNLRRNGVKGEILIFGYTHPQDFKYLVKYDLIQTVVDYDYAQTLNRFGQTIKVHIKIDTGMHRLGENYTNLTNLEGIFQLANLMIEGTYTHLSVSDGRTLEDIEFTKGQINHFYKTVRRLNDLGYDPGKLHIQSSYGVLNYPELHCDYARVGIALYGVLSSDQDTTRVLVNLKPVLSVKARIVMTKILDKGEAVSYGRTFTAREDRNIAVVTIGYADGIPRNMEEGQVLVKGFKAPIIGRICMDQLMIDITDIPQIEPDDIVTVIGREGSAFIGAEEVAEKSGTITNELLTRLGNRLNRIYIE
ncbi:serine racemase VanT catalytic subunit [Anaerocolumna sp. AGMB13025]|uniref:serine racemase VanT catalytic subunit n=1 Tax=Anaerocolumna sp. AGMB13025 TaxID=3039116 RepID=UPI00241EC5C4|nr:serine racemase VanT catalytic subunit [Anaerocolumna sp. AGMB13025]WFR60047.1 serine racemase VanT catalytic subunit [Anaerocolumna sp. AGMB13025]